MEQLERAETAIVMCEQTRGSTPAAKYTTSLTWLAAFDQVDREWKNRYATMKSDIQGSIKPSSVHGARGTRAETANMENSS